MFKRMMTLLVVVLMIVSASACAGPQNADAPPAGNQMEMEAEGNPTSAERPNQPEAAGEGAPAQPSSSETAANLTYPIVDTGQGTCYDASASVACPAAGEPFYGQDAQITGNVPSYTDNGDGTVTDNVTGLMWTQSPDRNGDGNIQADDKLPYAEAGPYCDALSLAGYDDWRLPDIKTLYSLMDFRGTDPIPNGSDMSGLVPFIDTDYFAFAYGDTDAGERMIDAQFASTTLYVSTVMNGSQAMFGLNLADGRIKGYPTDKTFYVYCVRNVGSYGANDFTDNGDGTITDSATGLMWLQDDNGQGVNWEDALAWVEAKNAESYLGYSDWRLPNAKELQSIVDYTRAPDTTSSAAIDPLFNATNITNVAGQADFPFYWSSTTHIRANGSGSDAVYVAFGRGLGSMDGSTVIDVHGAGCQRGDPKQGDPTEYPSWGNGPQGDVRRVFNYVRLVRGGAATLDLDGDPSAARATTGSAQSNQPAGQPPNGDAPGNAPQGQGEPGRQLPPEAIAACTGLTEGATCAFESPHGEVEGTCATVQEQIACVPEGGPGNGQPPGP